MITRLLSWPAIGIITALYWLVLFRRMRARGRREFERTLAQSAANHGPDEPADVLVPIRVNVPRTFALVFIVPVTLIVLHVVTDRRDVVTGSDEETEIVSETITTTITQGKSVPVRESQHFTRIDPADTAAYSILGPDAVAAVARCKPPACRPDIFRGPGAGEITVGLDSAGSAGSEFQWHVTVEGASPVDQAAQDSMLKAFFSQWDTASRPPLLLVDGVRRTFAWARDSLRQPEIWDVRQLSPAEAMKRSHGAAAANGALVITTKAHAPSAPR